MQGVQIFNKDGFGNVRTIEEDGKILFVASDIAKALGYTNPNKAINDHCRAITKRSTPISGKMQDINYISEGDIYRLVAHSKLESASRFESWVFDEVIPSIRKNGGYIAGQESLSDDELFEKAVLVAQKKIAERDKKIQQLEAEAIEMNKAISEMQPKVNYVDMILKSKKTMTVTQIAQDYGMSAIKFNKILDELGIQRKVNGQWILYGKHQGNGYVHGKPHEFTRTNGTPDVSMNTEWTQKGRLFLYEELKKHDIYPSIEKEE